MWPARSSQSLLSFLDSACRSRSQLGNMLSLADLPERAVAVVTAMTDDLLTVLSASVADGRETPSTRDCVVASDRRRQWMSWMCLRRFAAHMREGGGGLRSVAWSRPGLADRG